MLRLPQHITALIIDDDEICRAGCRVILQSFEIRCDVIEVDNLENARKAINENAISCILLDNCLSGESGVDFLKELTADDGEIYTPTIMMTGRGSEELAVEAMKQGAHDYISKNNINVHSLLRSLTSAFQKTSLLRSLQDARERLENLALYDQLTGLANRNLFYERLGHLEKTSSRSGGGFGILVLDLDGFKSVNDNLGHEAGDEALKIAAQRISGAVRESETLARTGGDEFIILSEQVRTTAQLLPLAKRIINAMKPPARIGENKVQLGISIGIATSDPEHLQSGEEIIRRADVAMYKAKKNSSGYHLAE